MPELPIKTNTGIPIGTGAYKEVFIHPHKPEKVAKENKIKPTPEERERWHLLIGMEFYLTKILSILHPEHIPDIHMASIADNTLQTIHQRVEMRKTTYDQDPVSRVVREIQKIIRLIYTPPTHKEIAQKLKSSGVTIDGRNPNNFGYHKGSTYYVDSPYWSEQNQRGHIKYIIDTDVTTLTHVVNQISDEQKRRQAQAYLGRFQFLFDMYKSEHTS